MKTAPNIIKSDNDLDQAQHTHVNTEEREVSPIWLFGANLAAAKTKDKSSYASKQIQSSGSDSNSTKKKHRTADVSSSSADNRLGSSGLGFQHRKTHCLILEKNIPEFLISGCLRCLSPRDEVDRCLVLSTDRSLYQWALRYTTVETLEVTVQKCGSSCGQIEWGSATDCHLVRSHHIFPSKGANYDYAKLKLRYESSHKEKRASHAFTRSLAHFF